MTGSGLSRPTVSFLSIKLNRILLKIYFVPRSEHNVHSIHVLQENTACLFGESYETHQYTIWEN